MIESISTCSFQIDTGRGIDTSVWGTPALHPLFGDVVHTGVPKTAVPIDVEI
jgi:hypothetical protein